MKQSITYEQIKKSLDNIDIPFEMVEYDENNFSRVFKFNILGLDYYIEWWSNVSYLHVGSRYGNSVAFNKIVRNDTYPMGKRAISFCMYDKEGFYDKFHLVLELLDWQR